MSRFSGGTFDVVVVGAGPAGSATAAYLAREGFAVALLDRACFPRPKPCAEYLSPGSVGLLTRLGAWESIMRERPIPLRGMRIVGSSGQTFYGRFLQGQGLGLRRERLDFHIARTAVHAGAELHEGVTFERLAHESGGLTLVCARRQGQQVELSARLVVGADGLNSRVARALSLARGRSPHRAALVTHAAGVTGMTDVGEMHLGPVGYMGLAPLNDGLTTISLVFDLARARVSAPLDHSFRALARTFASAWPRMASATLASPVRAVGPFGRTTHRATADGALLVGDAADFYDPFTGEGVYAALRGAELAAECAAGALRRNRLTAASLRPYDHARRGAFASKWALERIVSWVIGRPRIFAHVARRLSTRTSLADDLVSVTAHVAPASHVFHPAYVWRLAS